MWTTQLPVCDGKDLPMSLCMWGSCLFSVPAVSSLLADAWPPLVHSISAGLEDDCSVFWKAHAPPPRPGEFYVLHKIVFEVRPCQTFHPDILKIHPTMFVLITQKLNFPEEREITFERHFQYYYFALYHFAQEQCHSSFWMIASLGLLYTHLVL